MDSARHVIKRNSNPHSLCQMARDDERVLSIIPCIVLVMSSNAVLILVS